MAIHTIVTMRCNDCGAQRPSVSDGATKERANAKKIGWACDATQNQDICPDCVRTRVQRGDTSPRFVMALAAGVVSQGPKLDPPTNVLTD